MDFLKDIGDIIRQAHDDVEDVIDEAIDSVLPTNFVGYRQHQRQARDNFNKAWEEVGESFKTFFGF